MVMLQFPVELPPLASALEGRVRPGGLALPTPRIGEECSLWGRGEQLGVEELITESAVVDEVVRSSYDSAKPLSHGDPGSI